MFFTMKLIANENDTVTYSIWNSDINEKVNEITVNKHDKTYSLQKGAKISNHDEDATYTTDYEMH